MKYEAQLGDLRNQLAQARNILVALPATVSVDKLAAGLALLLCLKGANKNPTIVTEDTVRVAHTNLFGVGDIRNQLNSGANNNFILTLEGVVDANGRVPSVENMDWYPEGNNLNLVFHILPGQKFEPLKITPNPQSESGFDLIFIVGATNLTDLGTIYQQNLSVFQGAKIINIDNGAQNGQFGLINIVDANASSVCEIVAQLLSALMLLVDQDSATNLLTGIYDATANLTANVYPDTFISVAQALQAGGKLPQGQVSQQPVISSQPFLSTQPSIQNQQSGFDLSKVFQVPQSNPVQNQPVENFTQPPVVSNPTEEKPQGEFATSASMETENTTPAPDWLIPKVFKGSSLG